MHFCTRQVQIRRNGANGVLADMAELRLHIVQDGEQRPLTPLMAGKNVSAGSVPFFLGAGAYRHHIPATVDHLIQRGEFLTAYTPYQPEIAQGTLQTMFEFQTQVAALTGMEVANASMYDGSTACAEAAVMACRVTKRNTVVMSGGLHPHYADTTRTLCEAAGIKVIQLAPAFAPAHVAAIKQLVRRGEFDDGRIVRVQDNYVVQWTARPDPSKPEAAPLAAEYERPLAGLAFTPSPYKDTYAEAEIGRAHV